MEGNGEYTTGNSNRMQAQYVGKGSKDDEEEDPYAGLYEDVPQTVWREKAGEEDEWDEPLF